MTKVVGCIYKITYLPWENNNLGNPYMYVGSTTKDLEKYFGSVSSKKWATFWKEEVRKNPKNFKKEILFNCITNQQDLLFIENDIQREYNCVESDDYFNLNYANVNGCFGRPVSGKNNPMYGVKRDNEYKQKQSNVMTEVFKRPGHKEKMSKIQSYTQNRDDVRKKKSEKQKYQYRTNPSCRKNEWKPQRIHFQDVTFLSSKLFFQYLKETYIGVKAGHLYKRRKLFLSIEEINLYSSYLQYINVLRYKTLNFYLSIHYLRPTVFTINQLSIKLNTNARIVKKALSFDKDKLEEFEMKLQNLNTELTKGIL